MKLRVVLVALVIMVSIPTSAISAPIKSGASCNKVGLNKTIQGKKFTCVKKGNKSVWITTSESNTKKPVKKVKKSESNPGINTRAPMPAELVFINKLADDLIAKAMQAPPFTNYTLTVEPVLKGTRWETDYRNGIDKSFALLSALNLLPKQQINFYLSWTEEWAQSKKPNNQKDCWGVCPVWTEICKDPSCPGLPINVFRDAIWSATRAGMALDFKQYPSETWELGIKGDFPHEIGHLAMTRGYEIHAQGKYAPTPAWLREGWAEFFKVLFYAWERGISFSDSHKVYVMDGACYEFSILEFSGAGRSYPDKKNCEYSSGFLATQKLIYFLGGVEKIFVMPRGGPDQVAEIFNSTFLISLDEFAKLADPYVKQQATDRSWW